MFSLPLFGRDHPTLVGSRVTLRFPVAGDFAQWAQARGQSRAFLEKWEPQWASDELERTAWRMRLRRYREEHARGTGVTFLIFLNGGGGLVGGISVGNIRRGVAQAGQIGYWMSEAHAGRGLMVDALRLVVDHCFRSLRLHRLEAACIPVNTRSIRVLEKAGFAREGLLRAYLKINGAWQDHYLYALTEEEYQVQDLRGRVIGR